MPTGYTADVGEKDDYTFEEFVWACARAFGPLMHMRDDGQDAEIVPPEESSYYTDSIKEHEKELDRLKKLTLGQAANERDVQYKSMIRSAKESIEKKNKTRKRYAAIRRIHQAIR